jgi:atypical dual specificity phosphatase
MTRADHRHGAPTLPRALDLPPHVTGRLFLDGMPGRTESLDAVWSWLRVEAIEGIVCLTGDDEIAANSPAYAAALAAATVPCAVERFPIPDFGVSDDRNAFWQLATSVAARVARGQRILVHCGAGIGRTGTFAACVLLAMGQSRARAEAVVRHAGSHPETPAQRELVAWCAVRMSAECSDAPATGSIYRIEIGDGRTTEALVEAGGYAYAHSCVTSDNFPARPQARREREIVLIQFDRVVTSEDAILEAGRRGLDRPMYEDALYFGAAHRDAQRDGPIVFLHDPWFGFFGRRDVISLWDNAGRRELGLEGFDARWEPRWRFAFVRGAGGG